MSIEDENAHIDQQPKKSLTSVILMIVLMNLVFSFDSILSAMALTDTFWVMACAIIVGGILMDLAIRKSVYFPPKK